MTEDQWLKATEPDVLLKWLQTNKKNLASTRQCRLFSCACCRLLWRKLSPEDQERVELAENFADGLIEEASLRKVRSSAVGKGHAAVSWALWLPETWLSRPESAARSSAGYARYTSIKNHAQRQVELLRDIVANPYSPVKLDPAWLQWNGGVIRKMADSIYDDRAFDRLPILADALEDAGCTNEVLLKHCRSKGPHVRGCWAVDLLLGKS